MRTLVKLTLILGTLSWLPGALAQGVVWKHVQPWTPRLASHESRVRSCSTPQPFAKIALDDWICGATGPIIRLHWWGVLSSPLQAQRPFYVAIYANLPGGCQPNPQALLYSACVTPNYIRYRGTDCEGRRVYHLAAYFPTTQPFFVQQQGQHYWLQISEADEESIRPQLEDFRWSSHRGIKNCPAVEAPPITQPLLDACDGGEEDLAFGLGSRDISGVIVGIAGPLTLSLFDPSSGDLVEETVVEIGDEGNFTVSPEAPDGTYVLVLDGPGMLPIRRTVTLENGSGARMSFFDVFVGDLNDDDEIGINDLALMLSNYGRRAAP